MGLPIRSSLSGTKGSIMRIRYQVNTKAAIVHLSAVPLVALPRRQSARRVDNAVAGIAPRIRVVFARGGD